MFEEKERESEGKDSFQDYNIRWLKFYSKLQGPLEHELSPPLSKGFVSEIWWRIECCMNFLIMLQDTAIH